MSTGHISLKPAKSAKAPEMEYLCRSPFALSIVPLRRKVDLRACRGLGWPGESCVCCRSGEFHASILAACFTSSQFLALLHGGSTRVCSIKRCTRSCQQRPFTLALGWKRRVVARWPAHRLYRDHARSARPPLRPALDHGCGHAEIRPRGWRKRFRRQSTVVTGWQVVRVSGAPG